MNQSDILPQNNISHVESNQKPKHAIHQAVSHWLLTVEACIEYQGSEMGFVVNKVEIEQVFLQVRWLSLVNYLVVPCKLFDCPL
jgi:hypothetical protein